MERTHHVKKWVKKIILVLAKHVWTNDKYIFFSSISIQTQTLNFNRVLNFKFFLWEKTCWVFDGLGGTNCQWSCEFASSFFFFFFILFWWAITAPAVILCVKELFSWCIDIKETTPVTWPPVYYKPHIYTIGDALEI